MVTCTQFFWFYRVKLLGDMATLFNFLNNIPEIFCFTFYLHHKRARFSLALHLHQHCWWSTFLAVAIPGRGSQNDWVMLPTGITTAHIIWGLQTEVDIRTNFFSLLLEVALPSQLPFGRVSLTMDNDLMPMLSISHAFICKMKSLPEISKQFVGWSISNMEYEFSPPNGSLSLFLVLI